MTWHKLAIKTIKTHNFLSRIMPVHLHCDNQASNYATTENQHLSRRRIM